MTKQICEIGASSWFYYKEICYDAQSYERKIKGTRLIHFPMLNRIINLVLRNVPFNQASFSTFFPTN
jgi:hypothetical protein